MRKILLFISIFVVSITNAQNVSLCELMTQPLLATSNIFTSSVKDIKSDWNCDISTDDDKTIHLRSNDYLYHLDRSRNRDNMYYGNVQVTSVDLTCSDNTRTVIVSFDFSKNQQVKASSFAKMLKADIKNNLGVKMPGGDVSVQLSKLPIPFTNITITYDNDIVVLLYSFRTGQIPSFK